MNTGSAITEAESVHSIYKFYQVTSSLHVVGQWQSVKFSSLLWQCWLSAVNEIKHSSVVNNLHWNHSPITALLQNKALKNKVNSLW